MDQAPGPGAERGEGPARRLVGAARHSSSGRRSRLIFARRRFSARRRSVDARVARVGRRRGGGGATASARMLGEPFSRDLTVAQLRAFLLRAHRQDAVDEARGEAFQRSGPLHGPERRRRPQVQAELGPGVRGVDRLTARTGRAAEPPLELPLGDQDRTGDAERPHHGRLRNGPRSSRAGPPPRSLP